MFLETHAHLDMDKFADDLADVLLRARSHGVTNAIGISTHPDSFDRNQTLVETHEMLYGVIGVHPHQAELYSAELQERVEGGLAHPKFVAMGEIGLDYYYDFAPKATQQEVFREQLRRAQDLRVPFVVHLRDAADDLIAILKEEQRGLYHGVVHCFSEDWPTAETLLEMGFHLSFTGNVTFKQLEGLRDVLRQVPRDRVFIETDSPFMTPTPFRGKRCEPGAVPFVALQFAECWGVSPFEVGRMTKENAINFFRLPATIEEPIIAAPLQGGRYLNVTSRTDHHGLLPWPRAHGLPLDQEWWLPTSPGVDTLLDEAAAAEAGNIVLGGLGDPLLHDGFIELLEGVCTDGRSVTVETSGPTTGKDIPAAVERLRRSGAQVALRLCGHTEKYFREAHRPTTDDAFGRVLRFAKALREADVPTEVLALAYPKVKEGAFSNFVERELQLPLRLIQVEYLGG